MNRSLNMNKLRFLSNYLIFPLIIFVLSACTEPATKKSISNVLNGDPAGFSRVIVGKKLTFPEDHLAHPGFRQEWWYLTANLQTENGQKLGIQWTQFRIALSASNENSDKGSDWATNQIYLAHTAVTTENLHLAKEKWSRQHEQIADVYDEPLTIKLDNWQWQSQENHLFPALLTVTTEDFNYRLSLNSHSPIQLQGDEGYSRKSADALVASYYYSQPFVKISGELELEGVIHRVSGEGWLDREWSSQFLTESQQGWDWFSLKLNDGSALMLFQLRASSAAQQPFISARRMYPDGRGQNITSSKIIMTATDFQRINSDTYPVAWHIAIPSEQIDIQVNALNPSAKMPLSIPYWEGPIHFIGSHTGSGYMELTGY